MIDNFILLNSPMGMTMINISGIDTVEPFENEGAKQFKSKMNFKDGTHSLIEEGVKEIFDEVQKVQKNG